MNKHLDAIIKKLSPLGDVYYRDAVRYDDAGDQTQLEYPYWIVWPADARPGTELALDDEAADLSATIAVTSVATTPWGAQLAAANARDLLGPASYRKLDVPGHRAFIRWQNQVGGTVDRDVTLPGTNRHPSYEVDFYRLDSTPIKPKPELIRA